MRRTCPLVEKTKDPTALAFHVLLRIATFYDHCGKAYPIIKLDEFSGGLGSTQIARRDARGNDLFLVRRPCVRNGAIRDAYACDERHKERGEMRERDDNPIHLPAQSVGHEFGPNDTWCT